MIEVYGNLWTYPADWRLITTNGFVKTNGECVMGRGCALEAKKKYPTLPKELGRRIKESGNHPFLFEEFNNLGTFPVKHNWYEKADPGLIIKSAQYILDQLVDEELNTGQIKQVVMPRPGCGNGQLKWEDVKPLLEFLPNNVAIITWK